MTSDAPDIHTLSGAYALGALDDVEAAAFEGHLESCTACRDEVRSLTEVPPRRWPTSLPRRPRIAFVRRSSRPSPRCAPCLLWCHRTPRRHLVLPCRTRSRSVRTHRARRTSRWLAVAAAVLAVVAAGAVWRTVALTQQVTSITASAADVSAVLTSPDATTVTGSVSTGGRAVVVSSQQRGQAVLVADGLTPPPSGQTYQIRYLDSSGAATSAGFVPEGEHWRCCCRAARRTRPPWE